MSVLLRRVKLLISGLKKKLLDSLEISMNPCMKFSKEMGVRLVDYLVKIADRSTEEMLSNQKLKITDCVKFLF